MPQLLKTGDALLIVDVQNDFCPGGALPIENGDAVVRVLNRWITFVTEAGFPVFASRDWHPAGHVSFNDAGGQWPPHCLQDSMGACFHPELNLPDSVVKVTKGVRFDQDQNSAFDQTGFEMRLAGDGVKRLWLGGLAEDVCVLATALDACRAGFEVVLIPDATKPVSAESGENARRQMREAGVKFLNLD